MAKFILILPNALLHEGLVDITKLPSSKGGANLLAKSQFSVSVAPACNSTRGVRDHDRAEIRTIYRGLCDCGQLDSVLYEKQQFVCA